jgi:O-antigen ligase
MTTAARRRGRQRLGALFPLLVAVLILVFSDRRSADVTTGKFYIAAAVISVLVIIVYAVILRSPGIPRPLLWLALFTFVCLVNFPVAIMQGVPAIEWERHALPVICLPGFAYGAYLLNARAARFMYWVIAAVCGVITFYYLAFWLGSQSFAVLREEYNLAFWTGTGQTFAAVIAACLLYPFATRSARRWPAAGFVIAAAGVAASFARTFWAMAPAALVVTTILMARRGMIKASRLVLLAFLASVLAVAAGGMLLATLTARVDSAGLSGTQRVYEQQAILATMRSQPWTFVLGAGAGARYMETAVDTTSLSDGLGTDTRDFSHDWYLQLLWTVGILGLVAWVAALLSWLRLTTRSTSPYAVGCFAAVLAISLGALTYQPFGDLGWDVLIGLLLGTGCRLAREDRLSRRVPSGRPALRRFEEFVADH